MMLGRLEDCFPLASRGVHLPKRIHPLPHWGLRFYAPGQHQRRAFPEEVWCNSAGRGTSYTSEPQSIHGKLVWFTQSSIYIYILYIYGCFQKYYTPESSILIGLSITNHPFWGTPIFGNTHIYTMTMDPMGTLIDYPYAFKPKHHSIEGSFVWLLIFAVTNAKKALKKEKHQRWSLTTVANNT